MLASATTKRGNAKGHASVRLHHRGRRLGRLGHGTPAVGKERQQAARCARRVRTRRRATSRRRSPTAIPARPTSIRASTGPSSRSTRRSSSHNNPDENRPPLRKYEQARVLGGGSSINGQMANRGAPTDYDEWVSARCRRLGLERCAALFQEGRARPRLRRALSRQGRPHPGAPHPARALDRPRQRGGRGLRGHGLQVPARPERRVRRGLLPGHPLQRRGAARVGGDGLSRRRDAQAPQPHDLDRARR